jgi:ABC-type bacteriocin/lantibiotic exporter with double-glycine peptidase domain
MIRTNTTIKKLYFLLNRIDKIGQFNLMIIFSIVISFVELLSLISFYFALLVISGSEIEVLNFIIHPIIDINNRIARAFLVSISFFGIKFLISFLYIKKITKVIYGIQASIANIRISQLNKNYSKNNFSESALQREIIKDSHDVTRLGFNQLLLLVSEISIIILSVCVLFYTHFTAVFYSFLFISISTSFYLYISSRLSLKLGATKKDLEKSRIRLISDISKGLLELGLLNKLFIWSDVLRVLNFDIAKIEIKQSRIGQFSKVFFEIIGVISFFMAILIYSKHDSTIVNLITFTTTYGILLARLSNGVSKAMACYNNMKFIEPLVETINANEIQESKHTLIPDLENLEFSIDFRNIHFSYGNKKIIDGINFSFSKGEFIGVKGKSGSGKTTLTRLLYDDLVPSQGEIKLTTHKGIFNNVNLKNNIVIVSQTSFFFSGTILENIILDKSEPDVLYLNYIVKLLDDSFINEIAKDNFMYYINENLDNLSGGQLQKILLLRALYAKRQILILDEFTSALDSESEDGVLKLLLSLKGSRTIILISHREQPLKICDKVLSLN